MKLLLLILFLFSMSFALPPDSISFNQAMVEIDKQMSKKQRTEILCLNNPVDMAKYHFGLGLWIRNNLGLWESNSSLLQAMKDSDPFFDGHPDTASYILMRLYWAYAQGKYSFSKEVTSKRRKRCDKNK